MVTTGTGMVDVASTLDFPWEPPSGPSHRNNKEAALRGNLSIYDPSVDIHITCADAILPPGPRTPRSTSGSGCRRVTCSTCRRPRTTDRRRVTRVRSASSCCSSRARAIFRAVREHLAGRKIEYAPPRYGARTTSIRTPLSGSPTDVEGVFTKHFGRFNEYGPNLGFLRVEGAPRPLAKT